VQNLVETAEATIVPADGSGGGETGGDGEDTFTYSGTDISGLSSYHTQFTMAWDGTDEGGNPVNGTYTLSEAFTADPPASLLTWNMQGVGATVQPGSMETTRIGDVTYMLTTTAGVEPQCITLSGDGNAPSPGLSPDSFLAGSDLSQAKRVLPDEQINGVSARHYRATDVDAVMFGFDNYVIDIWVAQDGEYIVRQNLSGDGALISFGGGQGHVEWTYDLLDINGPVDIQPPAGCEAPAGGDFPTISDATNVTSLGTLLTYSTVTPAADVVAFYQAQLLTLGWVAGETTVVPGLSTLVFTRGEEKATLTISENGGTTTVLVTFE
jgi:hypothetical protein